MKTVTIRGQGELKRNLTPLNAWGIAFGCIIGWGAFVMPGALFLPQAGPLGTLTAILIGVSVMLPVGANCAYAMNCLPGEGGPYSYTREAFGKEHAFLCGWILCFAYVVIIPLNASSLLTISRQVFRSVLRTGAYYRIAGCDVYLWEIFLVQTVVLLLGVLSLQGKGRLRRTQTVLALTTVIIVALFLAVAAVKGRLWNVRPLFGLNRGPDGILTIVLLSPWAFVGIDTLSLSTREFCFSIKQSFRILAISILLGGFTYVALAWIAACGAPEGYSGWRPYIEALEMHTGIAGIPTFYAAKTLLGDAGVVLMFVAAVAAVLTCIIGFFRAAGRLLPAMAEDDMLPHALAGQDISIAFAAGVSILFPFLGQVALGWITDMASLGAVVGFGYISAAAYRLAVQRGSEHIRTTGAAGVVISALLAALQLIPGLVSSGAIKPGAFLVLAAWCLLGCVMYRSGRAAPKKNGRFSARTALVAIAALCTAIWVLRSLL